MNKIYYSKFKSPIGVLHLLANDKSLLECAWKKPRLKNVIAKQNQILDLAEKELTSYFSGNLNKFKTPIIIGQLNGTDFQKSVWKKLKTIPFGKTSDYKSLAKKVNSPKAYRAVGSANGKNPIVIFLPCHRIIQSSGKIGGYSGPRNAKTTLLELEGISEK